MTTGDKTTTRQNPRQLETARKLIRELAGKLNAQVSVRLWDGPVEPLGENVTSPLQIAISGPGVIGAILRRPSLDNIIRHYIDKRIDFSGGTLIDLGRAFDRDGRAVSSRQFKRLDLLRQLSSFLMTPAETPPDAHGFDGEISGRAQSQRDNKAFVQFHSICRTSSMRYFSTRRWSTRAVISRIGRTTLRRPSTISWR